LVYLRPVSPFPVAYYKGTVEVFSSYDGLGIVVWTIEFESKPEDAASVAELVHDAITVFFQQRFCQSRVRTQLEALTQHNEAAFPHPWAVSDAPDDFTERFIGAVVGIDLVITRLVGKWKVSQNQPLQNQNSVIAGLNANGKSVMAELVKTEIK